MRARPTRAELRARITEALVRDVGVSERMAQPFVESILGCFAGERQYFPAHERSYPTLQIKAALEAGTPVKRVMREYDVSRATLHRLFPGGLPGPQLQGSHSLPKVETK
jgi:hypothetical protein